MLAGREWRLGGLGSGVLQSRHGRAVLRYPVAHARRLKRLALACRTEFVRVLTGVKNLSDDDAVGRAGDLEEQPRSKATQGNAVFHSAILILIENVNRKRPLCVGGQCPVND